MNFNEAQTYINQIPKFTKKHTPQETCAFFEFLGRPAENGTIKIIHVAGTNGKGSVCAYMNSALSSLGFTTGMFTSPHLVSMCERIKKNGQDISEEEFVQTTELLIKKINEYKEIDNEYHPTFFEFLFFLNMMYFETHPVDYLILETGLGGCLDATNVIKNPILCIITEIGRDHVEYLGETLPEIAGQKAGIIKESVPVVYADRENEATGIILETAKNRNSLCILVKNGSRKDVKITNKGIDFLFSTEYYGYIPITIATHATYQVENASLVVAGLELLMKRGHFIDDSRDSLLQAVKGFLDMEWPARMQELLPGVFLDGAHNYDGICALLDTVKNDFCKGNRYLLFSAVNDKDIAHMAKRIVDSQLFDQIVLCRIPGERGTELSVLKGLLEQCSYRGSVNEISDPKDAFDFLLNLKEKNDYVYLTGSLYLAGYLLERTSVE